MRVKLFMRKITFDFVKTYFQSQNCKLLSTEYKDNGSPLEYICSCGQQATVRFYDFEKRGVRCKNCGLNKQKSFSESQKYSYDTVESYFRENGCQLLSKEYVNNKQKLDYICSCGRVSKIGFVQFRKGVRCRKCGREAVAKITRRDYKDILTYFTNHGHTLVTPESEYINGSQKVDYICAKGHENKVVINQFDSHGGRCPRCSYDELSVRYKDPNKPDSKRLETRSILEVRGWRRKVFGRDFYTCQVCDKKGNIQAHHLDGWNWCEEKRFDINNGITLCKDDCHKEFHKIYGKGGNTLEQFKEWFLFKTGKSFYQK